MKKLILSLDVYSWVKYCVGLVLQNSSEFQVMTVYRDSGLDGIMAYPRLCTESVEAQRRHDLLRISKKLGIRRTMNLNCSRKYIDIEQLSMNIKLQSTFNGINEIYYQYDELLTPVINTIGKCYDIEIYSFKNENGIPKKTVDISKFYNELHEIKDLMIGIPDRSYLDFPSVEKFY